MQVIQRWGRVAMVGAIAAVLSACAAYPQGSYQNGYPAQGGYQQGGYSGSGFPATTQTYPVGSVPAQGYPANNCGYNNPNCYSQQQQQPQYAQQGRVMNIETVRVQDGSGVGAGGVLDHEGEAPGGADPLDRRHAENAELRRRHFRYHQQSQRRKSRVRQAGQGESKGRS